MANITFNCSVFEAGILLTALGPSGAASKLADKIYATADAASDPTFDLSLTFLEAGMAFDAASRGPNFAAAGVANRLLGVINAAQASGGAAPIFVAPTAGAGPAAGMDPSDVPSDNPPPAGPVPDADASTESTPSSKNDAPAAPAGDDEAPASDA